MEKHELLIVGGGCAGIACALGAYENGLRDIVVVERDFEYGGILQQCIHNGFGLHTFNEELAGPTFAEKYYEFIKDNECIKFMYDSNVIKIEENNIVTVQSTSGLIKMQVCAIVMATGCRERPAGTIGIKGDRLEGVYSAGAVQKYCNKLGYLVGKNVFILGSGDIGLITARRMTLEGAHVIGVAEIMPYSNGLARNIKQCLEDFNIPLYLSHTVESVHGKGRLESLTLIEVDEKLQKVEGSEQEIPCDLLLLSVGLIPEINLIEELGVKIDSRTKSAIVDDTYMTSKEGVFVCGNALHVHDLVDYAANEARRCGKAVSEYVLGKKNDGDIIVNNVGNGVGYMVPQSFHKGKDVTFMFRVRKVFKNCEIHVYGNGIDKHIKKLGIVPSEMQEVKLKADELKQLGGELNWEVIE